MGGVEVAGRLESRRDPLRRTFASVAGRRSVIGIAPNHGKVVKAIELRPDDAVLGPMFGKRMRSLALEDHVKVLLGNQSGKTADLVVLAGAAVNEALPSDERPLLLLAPVKIREDQARAILNRKGPVLLLLPEIDEDGRSGFWKDLAEKSPRAGLRCQNLTGAGTQIDWAWKQVIDAIRE